RSRSPNQWLAGEGERGTCAETSANASSLASCTDARILGASPKGRFSMTALLMLLTAILQTEPAAEKSGLFEYKRPAGWSVVETPGGGRAHQAPDGSGAIVRFLPPEPWTGSAESYHEALHTAL